MGRPKGSKNKTTLSKSKEPKTVKKTASRGKKFSPLKEVPPPHYNNFEAEQLNVSFKKPSPVQINTLIKALDERDSKQKSLGLDAKELIDRAVEVQHLDKAAFQMVRKLWKMGQTKPEKLAITLPHLLSYIDDLQLDRLADESRGLPINGEQSEDVSFSDEAYEPIGSGPHLVVEPQEEWAA